MAVVVVAVPNWDCQISASLLVVVLLVYKSQVKLFQKENFLFLFRCFCFSKWKHFLLLLLRRSRRFFAMFSFHRVFGSRELV